MPSLAFENPPIIASFEIGASLLQNCILLANRAFPENIVHELVLFIDKIELNREGIANLNWIGDLPNVLPSFKGRTSIRFYH